MVHLKKTYNILKWTFCNKDLPMPQELGHFRKCCLSWGRCFFRNCHSANWKLDEMVNARKKWWLRLNTDPTWKKVNLPDIWIRTGATRKKKLANLYDRYLSQNLAVNSVINTLLYRPNQWSCGWSSSLHSMRTWVQYPLFYKPSLSSGMSYKAEKLPT